MGKKKVPSGAVPVISKANKMNIGFVGCSSGVRTSWFDETEFH